jgi:decaprenylphospho-beta-D-erythro-pentofuranosid-2-ulose 2-reductase
VINSLGTPQSLLLLGGASDIAVAIAERYLAQRPVRVVLAGRPSPRLTGAAERLTALGATAETVAFDAADPTGHEAMLEKVAAGGDIDVAVVAFGLLGDQVEAERDVAMAVDVARVNYVGAVSVGVVLGRIMRRQGHGVIVALSSVAGQRARRGNYLYGSTKAGLDAFYSGLGDSLAGSGVRVVVVRPGQVTTRMTAHLPAAPLTTTPPVVARAVVSAVRRGRHTVWVPGPMAAVSAVLRLLPRPVFRRLPF